MEDICNCISVRLKTFYERRGEARMIIRLTLIELDETNVKSFMTNVKNFKTFKLG